MKKLLLALVLATAASLALSQVSYREMLLASGARTVTGSGTSTLTNPTQVSYQSTGGRVYVRVTAVSGTTPTLVPTLYGEIGGNIYPLGSHASINLAGEYSFTVDHLPDSVRAGWTLGGTTPSFTFTVHLVRQ